MSTLTPSEVAAFALIARRDYGTNLSLVELREEAQRTADLASAILHHNLSKTS